MESYIIIIPTCKTLYVWMFWTAVVTTSENVCFSERFVKVYYFESVSHHFNTPGGGVTIYYYLIQSEKSVCVLVVTTTSRDTTFNTPGGGVTTIHRLMTSS